MRVRSTLVSLVATLAILAAATLAGMALRAAHLQQATIVVTYVLAVIGVALATPGGSWCLVASALSVLAFNFFFTAPTLSFAALDPAMPGTFAVMFLVALVVSRLADHLRTQARDAEAARARTQALLELSSELQDQTSPEEVVDSLAESTARLLGRALVWYPAAPSGLDDAHPFPSTSLTAVVEERPVALRALANEAPAGATTDCFSSASGLYVPLGAGPSPFGVAGIVPADGLAPEALDLWRTECGLAALALERISALSQREEASVRARDERTRADLLRSISHDLRTPLTSISGNADVLLALEDSLPARRRRELLGHIRDDADWLRATVENLLTVTRLEDGGLAPQTDVELVDDLVEEALGHAPSDPGHPVRFDAPRETLLIRADPTLVVQALVNLVSNAVAHTPAGTIVTVSAARVESGVELRVADNGPGIPDEEKGLVFDAFRTAGGTLPDGTRSVGLGLSVCRAVARAHGGTICVRDRDPRGCVFVLTLPSEEVPDVC